MSLSISWLSSKNPHPKCRAVSAVVMLGLALLSFCFGQESRKLQVGWFNLGVIDIHAHIGSFRGYDIGAETLLDNLQRYGIQLALISNIDGAEIPETQNLNEAEANKATAELVRRHPDLLRGLIWTRPEDGSPSNVESYLSCTLEDGKQPVFVGMKFHPAFNHFDADDPRVDGYLKLCEKYRIPAVFHCGGSESSSAPEKIYTVARRHPSVAVILYHMGFFSPPGPAISVAKEAITKHDAQLYLETAQASAVSVLQAIRQVGSDHVLFGSDATYYGHEHYSHYEPLITLLKRELPQDDFARVIHGNAEKLFHLGK